MSSLVYLSDFLLNSIAADSKITLRIISSTGDQFSSFLFFIPNNAAVTAFNTWFSYFEVFSQFTFLEMGSINHCYADVYGFALHIHEIKQNQCNQNKLRELVSPEIRPQYILQLLRGANVFKLHIFNYGPDQTFFFFFFSSADSLYGFHLMSQSVS